MSVSYFFPSKHFRVHSVSTTTKGHFCQEEFRCWNLHITRQAFMLFVLWSFVFPGLRGVWEQLRFTSVHSTGTPGLLEHQGVPSQVLCPNLSGEALLQPVPHQDGAGGSPVPPRQTRPTSGDGHRVMLLQPLFLPHVSGHVLPGLILVLRTPLPTRRAGPVWKEWSEIYIIKSWGGRAGDASEIMRLWIEFWHWTVAVESNVCVHMCMWFCNCPRMFRCMKGDLGSILYLASEIKKRVTSFKFHLIVYCYPLKFQILIPIHLWKAQIWT